MIDPRASAAANNAAWCDEVCRAAGLATRTDDDAWWSPTRTPPAHPDAVTLRPGLDAARLVARIDDGPGASVKDSFADLDLAPFGYSVLFDATWIHRPAGHDEPVLVWTLAPGSLPAVRGTSEDVAVLIAPALGARVALNRSGSGTAQVVGISNVDAADGDPVDVWRDLSALARATFGPLPLVGYEADDGLPPALAAGFTTTGPLRIWVR